MNVNELRIDNLILLPNGELAKVGYEMIRALIVLQKKPNYKPIPLNKEWLVRFGFKEFIIDSWYSKIAKNKNTINISLGGLVAINEAQPIRAIEFVHELQNLYFALTGQELTFK